MSEIEYLSQADSTLQPALFYYPGISQQTPLLVALHTWSGDYLQKDGSAYAEWCIEKNWAMIHPNFRGPNNNPEATGSSLVIDDIMSAVMYARKHANIDSTRIYLVGSSGGGYTALLMLGNHPGIWAGVSAWVPIADLRSWYDQTSKEGRKYAQDIINACGGKPGESSIVDKEYLKRSPITYLSRDIQTPVDINAGIHEGHTGSVPVSHSIRAFNLLAQPWDEIDKSQIEFFVETQSVPKELQSEISDEAYGEKQPLFRRSSENVRLTIFDGGHEIIHQAAFRWLSEQRKNKGSIK